MRSLPFLARLGSALLLISAFTRALAAQTDSSATQGGPLRPLVSGGRRSADGRREVLAVRAGAPVRLDGVLDDEVWKRAEPAVDFVQSEPLEGQPATESTEVRVVFDDDNLFVGAVLRDREASLIRINDIKKDFREDEQDDFEVLLDTFGDRRSGYVFSTNALGAKHDRQVTLEGREINLSWDAAWDVRTRRSADGWTVEMRIPFKALRFGDGAHAWGVNFSRHIRRKNEVDFWAAVPRAYNLNRVSLAANLAGLTTGKAGRDLRVKPYIAANTVRETGTTALLNPAFNNSTDIGVDLRMAVTSGLTGDVTVNPDFGQVEADVQQVNLTQFSQFYPEKRDFFLENSGVFYIGDAARNNRVNPTPTPDEDNLLFFTRRIGLTSAGRQVPIVGGMRFTGKLTESTRLGVLSIQERAQGPRPGVNSTALRFRQNLGRVGTDIGVFLFQRENTSGADTGAVRLRRDYRNRVFGVDNNIRVARNIDLNSYVVKTETPGVTGGDYAWRSTINKEGNYFHFKSGAMQLGDGFQNDLGYYRRTGVRKYLLDTGIRPRSKRLHARGIREFHPHVVWDYQQDLAGNLLQKKLHTGWSTFFNNGAVMEYSANPTANRLTAPFLPNANMAAPLAPGLYGWLEHQVFVTSDQSRMFATSSRVIWGEFYNGSQRSFNGNVEFRPSYRFVASAGLQRTAATLTAPSLRFVNNLTTYRASFSFTTNMFVDALSQYDRTSKRFNANVRFNIIHHPLSDLFVVYNDQRFLTSDNIVPGRSVVVKATQMLSF